MNSFPLPKYPYTRTYRLDLLRVAKLSHLVETMNRDQSEIMREALDEYFDRHGDDAALIGIPTDEDAQR